MVQTLNEAKAVGNNGPGEEELRKLIASAQTRSRKVRIITIILLFGLIAVGVLMVVRQRAADERADEARKKAEQAQVVQKQLEAHQKQLEAEAQRAREASVYIASGAHKAGRGNFKGALGDYSQALAIDPGNPGALSLEGYLRLRMGDSQGAEDLLRKSVQTAPDEPWHRYNLALALWENGKHDEAIAQLQQAVTLEPSFRQTIAQDPQFHKFRSDQRFKALIQP